MVYQRNQNVCILELKLKRVVLLRSSKVLMMFCIFDNLQIMGNCEKKIFFVVVALSLYSSSVLAAVQMVHTISQNQTDQTYQSDKIMAPIFRQLPSLKIVEEIILSGDSFALAKLSQQIANLFPSTPCEAFFQYSDQVIGIIRIALQMRRLALEDLSAVIDTAQTEIDRLISQMSAINLERVKLNIKDKIASLENLLTTLNKRYTQFNTFIGQSQILDTRKVNLNKRQLQLKSHRILETDKQTQHYLKLSSHDTEINKLKGQIQQIQNRKKLVLKQIELSQDTVKGIDRDLRSIDVQMSQILGKIGILGLEADRSRKQYTLLEGQLQSLGTDVSNRQLLDSALLSQAALLEDQLQVEKGKLFLQLRRQLESIVSTLLRNLPKFIEQNVGLRFDCHGLSNSVEVLKSGNGVMLLLRGDKVSQYLQSAFKIGQVTIENDRDRRLFVSDPYSLEWTQMYGPVLPQASLRKLQRPFLPGGFNCLSPSQTVSGQGQIKDIQGSQMLVQTNKSTAVNLQIGPCSRIESKYPVPRLGQKIYFRGIYTERHQTDTINLYQATCL